MTPLHVTDDTLWFVYSDSKHAGPFTSEQLASRMNRSEFGDAPYIWSQGMDDWKRLDSMPDLETFFLEAQAYERVRRAEAMTSSFSLSDKAFVGLGDHEVATAVEAAFDPTLPYTAEELALYTGSHQLRLEAAEAATLAATDATDLVKLPPTLRDRVREYRVHLTLAIAIVLTIAGWGLNSARSRHQDIRSDDVTATEYQEIRRAIGESLRFAGPTAAIAVSQSRPETPSFYIGANVEDGAKLDVSIEGIPETLLGRFHYSMRTTLVLNKGFVKTPPLSDLDGSAMKSGAYRIQIRPSGDSRVIAQKVYFLGGIQDLTYEAKLKDYHQQLREQAAVELMEVRQLSDTIVRQMDDANRTFASLIGNEALTGVARRAKWSEFNTRWTQIDSQLNAIAAQWTPEAANTIYYASLYTDLKSALEGVQKIHSTQTARLEKGSNKPALDSEIARLLLSSQTAVHALIKKTEKLQAIAPKAAGLPPSAESTLVGN